LLVVASGDACVDGDIEHFALHLSGGGTAFEVVLLEESLDRARVGLALPVPETNLLAVGEEGIGDIDLAGVILGLLAASAGLTEKRLASMTASERP
jgi:hypothetical protein